MKDQDFDISEEVLNLSTGRWIKKNGKLFQKLLRKGYKYTKDLSHYLDDVPLIDLDEYGIIYPLADFFYSALIPSLSTLAKMRDICKRYPISMGYPGYNLSQLLEMCWNHRETQEWRNDILARFLHHPNLTLSKYKLNALYDAFSKTDALGQEHILAIARTL
ncbi:3455_t:CDS:2 [Cetraspora pellucida]|uniref:3455_t:CDS:1 n=1 Tax=Cetraspora pellucida TaxID=1433469 RepID=A0A9N9CHK9_9GLOM|nr:3455_t:CDS:2 [Cetraspora pellucida]